MKKVIFVENGAIKGEEFILEQALKLPDGRTVSNADHLSNEFLVQNGVYPVIEAVPAFDVRFQRRNGKVYTVQQDRVVIEYKIETLPTELWKERVVIGAELQHKRQVDVMYAHKTIPNVLKELLAEEELQDYLDTGTVGTRLANLCAEYGKSVEEVSAELHTRKSRRELFESELNTLRKEVIGAASPQQYYNEKDKIKRAEKDK